MDCSSFFNFYCNFSNLHHLLYSPNSSCQCQLSYFIYVAFPSEKDLPTSSWKIQLYPVIKFQLREVSLMELTLPVHTIFPVWHSIAILVKTQEGKTCIFSQMREYDTSSSSVLSGILQISVNTSPSSAPSIIKPELHGIN